MRASTSTRYADVLDSHWLRAELIHVLVPAGVLQAVLHSRWLDTMREELDNSMEGQLQRIVDEVLLQRAGAAAAGATAAKRAMGRTYSSEWVYS